MIKSALEAVSCINSVFSALDKIVDQQHNVYKVQYSKFCNKNFYSSLSLTFCEWLMQVETIGNVYMVVGGAPTRYESHVKDISMGM